MSWGPTLPNPDPPCPVQLSPSQVTGSSSGFPAHPVLWLQPQNISDLVWAVGPGSAQAAGDHRRTTLTVTWVQSRAC